MKEYFVNRKGAKSSPRNSVAEEQAKCAMLSARTCTNVILTKPHVCTLYYCLW